MDAEAELHQTLRDKLFQEISQKAQLQMRNASAREAIKGFQLLRLSISPSFENPRIWVLHQKNLDFANSSEPQSFGVRQVMWDWKTDEQRVQDLLKDKIQRLRYRHGKLEEQEPTIEISDKVLDPGAVNDWFAQFRNLRIPLDIEMPNRMGLDGTAFTLEVSNNHMWGVTLSWWSDQPPEWAPLRQLTRCLLEIFRVDQTIIKTLDDWNECNPVKPQT
jgi:hypothetical protein